MVILQRVDAQGGPVPWGQVQSACPDDFEFGVLDPPTLQPLEHLGVPPIGVVDPQAPLPEALERVSQELDTMWSVRVDSQARRERVQRLVRVAHVAQVPQCGVDQRGLKQGRLPHTGRSHHGEEAVGGVERRLEVLDQCITSN